MSDRPVGVVVNSVEQSHSSEAEVEVPGKTRALLVRNTLYLTVSQALTVPLSMLVNVVAARYLGPDGFGVAYLASTMCYFGFLAVSWGHEGVLPAVIARDPSLSGTVLASSLAWRTALSAPIYGILALGSYLFGYGAQLQWALLLTALQLLVTTLIAACKDAMRGLERTDIPAYAHVGQQLLSTAIVVPVLILGGKLSGFLIGQLAACVVVFLVIWSQLRPAGIGKLSFSASASKLLFTGGTPFVVSGLVMALQPNIDAVFLSKLAPLEVMGWYAVTRRLVGVLLFPASALIGALYPTLCRLWSTDREGFERTTSGSLRGVCLLVVPVALGCALYSDFAIAMFSRKAFGPAADCLRLLSVFIFLVYFTMPLGTAILAAEKQRVWSIVQSLCLVVSVALDPLLVPWFQRRMGNGGLGVCVATVVSEFAVVACGVALAPKGIFDRKFIRCLLLSLLAGVAMAAVARLTSSITPFVAGPLSLFAYVGALWITGAIEKEQMDGIRGFFTRKLSRLRAG